MRLLLFFPFLLACTEDQVDTSETGEVDPECVDAQLVSYNNFGKSFMTHSCQGCHATTAPDRYDAPEDVSFDDLESVWDKSGLILAVATGPESIMPPLGGVTDIQRTKLVWWLRCGEKGL
jgi:cytochrome c5